MKLTDLNKKSGGAATSETIRISRSDLPATITYISTLCKIPRKDLHPVGSTGKLDSSGDIDLAVDLNLYPPDVIHNRLIDKLGVDACCCNMGTGIYSYAVPIKGDNKKGSVQVDLMFTTNVDWAKFAYHSEGEGGKYKGAIRTILLSAVASTLQHKGVDYFEYDGDGTLILRIGRSLDLNRGLRRIFQIRPLLKGGPAYSKRMKTTTLDEIKQQFPNVNVSGGQLIIDDPSKVVTLLFGGKTTPDDVHTTEQVIQLIKRKFNETEQKKIFSIAGSRLKGMKGKMRIPPEVLEVESPNL